MQLTREIDKIRPRIKKKSSKLLKSKINFFRKKTIQLGFSTQQLLIKINKITKLKKLKNIIYFLKSLKNTKRIFNFLRKKKA